MKLIIAGGRNFQNYQQLCKVCGNILQDQTNIEIVNGTCRGADKLGEQYAKEKRLKIKRFPANWNKYGKAAGPKRNQQMANYADALIAFWDGKSRGTKNMIDLAKQANFKVKIINF